MDRRRHATSTRLRALGQAALVVAGLGMGGAALAQPGSSDPADAEIARDELGQRLYTVDLRVDAQKDFSQDFTPSERFAPYLAGQAVNLVQSLEAQYGFQARQMTSVTRLSFTAPLTEAQIKALAIDPRVVDVAPAILMYPSTPPTDTTAVWRDSANTTAEPPYSQWKLVLPSLPAMQAWGQRAVNNASPAVVANGPVVYVLDVGTGLHAGLPNVVERVNGVVPLGNDCGSRPGLSACTPAQLANVVGCYSHATMVAGVVGASNAQGGTRGVYPGVSIVSVSLYRPPAGAHGCVSGPLTNSADVAQALDWIGNNILATNHTGRPSVVNLSFNWSFNSQVPTGLLAQIQAVTHMTPGALFVQSAGNFYRDACASAYTPTQVNDGVLVVGAINAHGQPVRPLNGVPGFWKDVAGPLHQSGSNYGACVEAWAPGDAVLTSVGDVTNQQGATTYSSYAYVSGTSLAAPHVVGLAAALIASDGTLTTPALVEAKVRSTLRNLGSHDADGLSIFLPSLNAAEKNKVWNTPYAELWVTQQCYIPYFATFVSGCTFLREPGEEDRPNLFRDHDTLYRRPNIVPLMSLDSKGEGSYTCDVKFTDTGFESHVVATGQKQYFIGLDATALGSSLPGTLSSTLCPSATVRLATD
ncbi:S8 family serine peptidase [Corallococcus sp. M34]|uniref:S8 family serine peptidase n=1 Tax=Citreicoccus inhibens TaxID=2849499 RepID=UPI001C2112B9|nr:S8 family serine peptidase [Citreicoccus inhibens]MBU8900350.1 S8 family serine peptidase [Citreicoccus inhibens]